MRHHRVLLSEPLHLIAAGRLEVYREVTSSDEISHKSRVYLQQRFREELNQLLVEMQEALVLAGYSATRCTPVEVVVDRSPELDGHAWLSWRRTERSSDETNLLGLHGKTTAPKYFSTSHIAVETADLRTRVIDTSDPMLVFLANIEAWASSAAEELTAWVRNGSPGPKERWDRFKEAAAALSVMGSDSHQKGLEAMLLRGRWLLQADVERRLKEEWLANPEEAGKNALGVLAALVSDWLDAGEDGGTQPRSKLGAAADRAEYLVGGLNRILATRIRELGEAQGLKVISHRVLGA